MNHGQKIAVVNPLKGALAHYCAELEHDLRSAGAEVTLFEHPEPSLRPDQSRLRWVIHSLRARRAASTSHDKVIVAWPVLGYIDLILNWSRNTWIVVHDPIPLVRAVGNGRISRGLAARSSSRTRVLVHSETARRDLPALSAKHAIVVPHPMLPPLRRIAGQRSRIIRVLGQFKSTRDLSLLREIAVRPDLASFGFEIIGRGWPRVEGWSVRDEFVSEDQMQNLLATSAAVLLPYKRFYQSGIAIRALEMQTPVIGPRDSSLASLFPEDHPALVTATSDPASWSAAILATVEGDSQDEHGSANLSKLAYDRARSSWSRWLEEA